MLCFVASESDRLDPAHYYFSLTSPSTALGDVRGQSSGVNGPVSVVGHIWGPPLKKQAFSLACKKQCPKSAPPSIGKYLNCEIFPGEILKVRKNVS